MEHGPGGELVGVDAHGNKYYEKKDAQIGAPHAAGCGLAAGVVAAAGGGGERRALGCALPRQRRQQRAWDCTQPASQLIMGSGGTSPNALPPLSSCSSSSAWRPAVRNRWVVFADSLDYRTQDPSTVPPEWHGWLHQITDQNPTNVRARLLVSGGQAVCAPGVKKCACHHRPRAAQSCPQCPLKLIAQLAAFPLLPLAAV